MEVQISFPLAFVAGLVSFLSPCILPVNFAAAVHLHPHLLREGGDDGGANAVQPAGDFVHRSAELAAGVEVGHHRLQR